MIRAVKTIVASFKNTGVALTGLSLAMAASAVILGGMYSIWTSGRAPVDTVTAIAALGPAALAAGATTVSLLIEATRTAAAEAAALPKAAAPDVASPMSREERPPGVVILWLMSLVLTKSMMRPYEALVADSWADLKQEHTKFGKAKVHFWLYAGFLTTTGMLNPVGAILIGAAGSILAVWLYGS